MVSKDGDMEEVVEEYASEEVEEYIAEEDYTAIITPTPYQSSMDPLSRKQ